MLELDALQFTLDQLMGTRFIGSAGFFALCAGFISALRMFFLMFLCRVCLRRPWLATPAYVGLVTLLTVEGLTAAASFSRGDWIGSIVVVLIVVLTILIMVRFGLLALAVWGAVGWFQHGLLTSDLGAWYGESSLVVVVVVSALALWAFRTSLGGRPLLSADPLKA